MLASPMASESPALPFGALGPGRLHCVEDRVSEGPKPSGSELRLQTGVMLSSPLRDAKVVG